MRKMKDSGIAWVGTVPDNWLVMANKYLMKKIKIVKPTYEDEDILSLTVNGVVVRDLEAGGKMPTSFDGYQTLYPGNLLMCLFDYDVTPRCIGLIKNNGVTSPAYSQFIMKDGNIANFYYYYYLMVDHTKALLHLAKNLRHSFTEEQLGMIAAPVPPLSEQRRIATYLDAKCAEIDALVADIQSQIDTLEQYNRSVITKTVTKGLNPDAEMKDSGIEWVGQIPAHWYMSPAKYFILISNGSNPVTDEGETPVYGSGMKSFKTCVEYKMGPAVLLGRKGTINVPQWVENKYWNVDTAFDVKCKSKLIELKYYFYLSICFDYDKYFNQTTLPSMTQSNYNSMKIPIPPLLEQRRIAAYLDAKCADIDSVIATKESQLETLDAYKKSLIFEYVTGKKEVPDYE